MIHIRLFHHVEELARIGREAFDVAALPLCIDRVKRQAGLARTGQAGDYHQLIARDIHVDALEVMFPRTANFDRFQLSHTAPKSNVTHPCG